ncbi:regulatory protein TetR [Halococcus morrhuae DSM 1307]|uniref:Regulatory protein TetR n=1 Tax=Halococcus morrhuae DSM 1307 TaxID=931277 RepID=M0MQW2_HALMO|nr:TetR/AcrR family transcriptional regulator [Halococcus morrhuae]EMA48107.1 regulatory protein TetR [Halococcus morrhuae DSM 1307]
MSADTARNETQIEIMEATYRALCEHGYADLTIQAIADEFDKSKSLLYYHYDTKDEILIAFLSYLLDQFSIEDAIDRDESPDEQLWTLVDEFLPESPPDEHREFQLALFELRSRALSKEAYREQFTRVDRLIHDAFVDVLAAGVDDGSFREIGVEETATLLVSTVTGAMLRRVTTDDDVTAAREAVVDLVESRLIADGDD